MRACKHHPLSASAKIGESGILEFGGDSLGRGACVAWGMIDEQMIRYDYEVLRPGLNERGRRLFAAAQARALGYGGVAAVARATGIAPSTIGRGLKELANGAVADGRARRAGGGRKKLVDRDANPLNDLLRLVEPATLGDPERPLRWVSKSHAKLAAALQAMGHKVSPQTVQRLLRQIGYRRQGNAKALEIADQLLLLGIDRNHRLLCHLKLNNTSVDVLELRIPVGMTAVAPTARVCGYGRSSCRSSPTRPSSRFRSVIIRPALQNGTRSSIACSATSRRIGGLGRS
jgi:Rhodopirellula transposase DDE domain